MAQQHYLSSPAPPFEDDLYNVTPQQTGVTQAGPAEVRWEDEQQQHHGDKAEPENPFIEDPFDDHNEEKPPCLPPRRSSSFGEDTRPTNHPNQPVTYHRSKEHIMAYMIPLPAPRGAEGQAIPVPQRYMLYLPPAPDLLKPPADSDIKERKRDKCARKWQAEVRKAKSYSGSVISFSGLYCASVRGAVYCLSLVKRSELTFLSRLPRNTLRELEFVYPAGEATQDRRRFELIKEEFTRNKRIAQRDFWIGAVFLPFAQGIDFAIPVGGGFSEVTLVWMIVTGGAWRTASGMMKRLVYNDAMEMRTLSNEHRRVITAGEGEDQPLSPFVDSAADPEKADGSKPKSRWKKAPKPPVETVFRASDSLDPLARYLQAACHSRNASAFPDAGSPATEAGVLTSIGWQPAVRAHLNEEESAADTAWQIRQATEDLREAVSKAAMTWDKFCAAYVKDPERALREEAKEAEKKARKEEKERAKSAKKAAKENGLGGQ